MHFLKQQILMSLVWHDTSGHENKPSQAAFEEAILLHRFVL